ncbi:proton-coupled amino acid transporter-like protein pathetic [Anticarsia gemmatalis]|uniref:proton-coupled amino acid transporter-like protein pathetic n=1 Tax=Anticarsia gemmatalis TaxID=129554 RepID=UPI003F76E4B9
MELTERNEKLQGQDNSCFDPNETKPPPEYPAQDYDPKISMSDKQAALGEKEEYDFVAHRPPHKPTTLLESTGHLIKGCLGGGILGIPEAYMKAGLWTSFFTTIGFGFYITYCVYILITAAQNLYVKLKIPMMSYPDLAEKSLEVGPFPKLKKYGKTFRYVVDAVICIDLFGACAVYQIIIAKTIQQLMENIDTEGPISSLRIYILAIFVPCLLLCMIRSLKYLAPFTLLADFFIVMCVASTIVYALKVAPPIEERPAWKDPIGFFEFCGIVVFSMEGIGVSLPIENNMKNPKKFPIILCAGMTVVVSFLMLTAFFGYWGWGEKVISPITLNFPRDVFPTTLKALMAIMIFITFGLNFWAPFNLVWHYLRKHHPENRHYIWERVYRAGFVILITLLAVAFPNMGPIMGLIGSFCLSNMGFIFPSIIETLAVWERPGLGFLKWRLWKNILIMIMGIILLLSGTYSSGKALLGL